MKKYLVPLLIVIAAASLIYNVVSYYRYTSTRPLVLVNGEPITRKAYEDRLDYMYSKPVLQEMIWETLFRQQATKLNVVPTPADISDGIASLTRTSPQVLDQARQTDPNLSLFKQELQAKLELQNIRMEGINITDAQARQYYARHKSLFMLPQQTNTTMVVARDSIDAATAERLLQNGVAPSIIARQPDLGVIGINMRITNQLPPEVGQAVLKMKSGEVRIMQVQGQFLVIEAKSISQADVPPYDSIKQQVLDAARLDKAPSAATVIRNILASSTVTAESSKYEAAIPSTGDTDNAIQ